MSDPAQARELGASDVLAAVRSEQARAVAEDDYATAARLRDVSCQGLVGWWAASAGAGEDPHGHVLQVRLPLLVFTVFTVFTGAGVTLAVLAAPCVAGEGRTAQRPLPTGTSRAAALVT